MGMELSLAIAAALVLGVILLRAAAARRPMLVNPSSMDEKITPADLRARLATCRAFYSGALPEPTALLLLLPSDRFLVELGPGWKPVEDETAFDELAYRLQSDGARLLVAATARNDAGRRIPLGYLLLRGYTAPRPKPGVPDAFTLAPPPPPPRRREAS